MEHVEYVDQSDGSRRTRVRFNVEGPNGHGVAYAEVSHKMRAVSRLYSMRNFVTAMPCAFGDIKDPVLRSPTRRM